MTAGPGPGSWADRLPTFPWDLLAEYARCAAGHPGGLVDLSIGAPVDPVPKLVRRALAAGSATPGYPATAGTAALREAVARWLTDRVGVRGIEPDAVLPTIGSKELISLLPFLLGARPGDRVLLPSLAYPTYDLGARLAGCQPVRCDEPLADPTGVALVWLNSPSNPTGRVLSVDELRGWVDWGRRHGVPVANDECYLELGWEAEPRSLLHPDVCGADHAGLLAVHSLSKRSNLAGYRAGFVAGDRRLVAGLLEVRRHIGLIVPAPVQAAMCAALADAGHVREQRARYAARRAVLRPALVEAGFTVEHSEAGLYLWATRGEDSWESVGWLADRGILAAPGTFYGEAGHRHVRLALTATDAHITAAAARLSG
ncbi:MAG TPA: succinyldiaminopimelate transaminase [Mycobacteriales bacterium]|nr:succinyldiaminopimelate transaminase [Mycobacteriales bacterium]